MGKLFDLDSPFMRALTKIADLMWVNILTVFCCIPIITVGTSLAAMHYTVLKIRRDEGSYISKEFFKAFKVNFKQGTAIWLLFLLCVGILAVDYYVMYFGLVEVPQFTKVVIMAINILLLMLLLWVFPVQAKFSNTVPRTIKNAFVLSVIKFPRTLAMAVYNIVPWVLLLLGMQMFPIVLLFGLSAPAYGSACLYDKVFKGLEEKILERMEEEKAGVEGAGEASSDDEAGEKIFSDKLIIGEKDEH